MLKRVLLTTDFSEIGNRAIDYTFKIMAHSQGTIFLCSVNEVPGIPSPLYAHYTSEPIRSKEELNELHVETERKLRALIPADVEKLDVSVEIIVIETQKHVHDTIIDLANEINVDCIIMSTHGIGGFSHILAGSTTRETLENTNIPILIIPPKFGQDLSDKA